MISRRRAELEQQVAELEHRIAELEAAPAVGMAVIVNMKTGNAVRGVLHERGPGWLIMKGVDLLEPAREPTPLAGDVVVELLNVDFVQILPAG